MKPKKSKVLAIIVLSILILVGILPVVSLAANSNVIIIKQNENEYLIYSDTITDKESSFAFGNSSTAANLNYIRVISDSEGNYVAYVDKDLMQQYFNSGDTYIWIKTNDKVVINGEKITLDSAITIDEVNQITSITKNITIGESSVGAETIQINGTEGETYYYQFFSVNSFEKYSNLVSLIETASNYNDSTSMYEKLQTYIAINELYTSLLTSLDDNSWVKTENLTITKPYAATDNQQYLLWLKDENGNIDIQILTAYTTTVTVTTQQATTQYVAIENVETALPYTYDEITNLLVALGIVILAIVAVLIFKKVSKNGKKDLKNEK